MASVLTSTHLDISFVLKTIATIRLGVGSVTCGLLLAGCSPSYFMTTKLSRPSGLWPTGYARSDKPIADSVVVRLGFVRYEQQELVFEADVRNVSSRSVVVAPETFYYLPIATTPMASVAPATNFPTRVAAINPELRLAQLATRLAEETDLATKVSLWELFTTVSNLAENNPSKKKETEVQVQEREQRHRQVSAYFAEQYELHAVQADKLFEIKQSLEYRLLRTTTLEPGQHTRGYVCFPRTDAANLLQVVAALAGHSVTFDFVQKVGVQQGRPVNLAVEAK
ncbi:hypothetical protein [Hymenobacter volaticus]|uniref:Uncharacterized protein n=1 Tax=Hymenobacter volaticus TaxID=2932254 RepID=A0ABY4G284_9BACT|nr:hypothetical protein [Hymenobacter volaticus]UOQ64912.1 hypothetical protein MUN86_15245 [Hymenobacter volaticus]